MAITSTIWVYSDPVIMRTALVGVKAIMTSTPYQSLITIFFLLALIATIFPAMFKLSSITRYYVSLLAIVMIISMPTMDVTITPSDNPMGGTITVPGAPLFVALPASIFSSTGKWMAETYEQVAFVLMGLSPDLRVFGAGGGLIGGSIRALLKSTGIAPPLELSSRATEAFQKCIIPSAILWNDTYPTPAIEGACRTALGVLAPKKVKAIDCLSQIDTIYALNNMADPMPISTGSGTSSLCDTFSKQVATDLVAWGARYGNQNLATSSTSFTRNYKAVMGQLEQKCAGGLCSGVNAANLIAGQSSGTLLAQALLTSGSASGLVSSLQAKVGAGSLAGQSLLGYMPLAMDGILAFMTLLFPIVVVTTVFSASQGGTVSKLGNFYISYLALSLVPSVMAVLNSFMTYYMVYKSNLAIEIATQLGGVVTSPTGIMLISSYSQAPASAMGYMMAAAPAITWAIVNSGAVPAGEMLGNMMSGGSAAMESGALGNFSANNLNANNKSFNEKDNTNSALQSLISTGGLQSHSQQTQENSNTSRAKQNADTKAVEEVTGNNARSPNGVANTTKSLTSSAILTTGQSVGAGDQNAKDAKHSGLSSVALAKRVGSEGQYNKAVGAIDKGEGTRNMVNENTGIDPNNVAAVGELLSGVTEQTQEDAQAKKQAMIELANKTGVTNQQSQLIQQRVTQSKKLGAAQGETKAAHDSGTSVQKHARTDSFLKGMADRGSNEGIESLTQATGMGPLEQGKAAAISGGLDNLVKGASAELGFKTLAAMGYSKDNMIKNMSVAQATQFASKIGQSQHLAEMMGFKGGLKNMNDEQRQAFIKLASSASVGAAMKEASEIKAGQILSKRSSSALAKVSQGMAVSGVFKDFATGEHGDRIIRESSNKDGSFNEKKFDTAATNAGSSDYGDTQTRQEKGKLLGSVSQSRKTAQFAASKAMGEVLGAQSVFSNSDEYSKTIQTAGAANLKEQEQKIASLGGTQAAIQQAGLSGAVSGSAQKALLAARGNLNNKERAAISNLPFATKMASFGMTKLNSNLPEGQERFTADDMQSLLSMDHKSEGYQNAVSKITNPETGNVAPLFQPMMEASDALYHARSNLMVSGSKEGSGEAGHKDALAIVGGMVNQAVNVFRGVREGDSSKAIQDSRNSNGNVEQPGFIETMLEGAGLAGMMLLGRVGIKGAGKMIKGTPSKISKSGEQIEAKGMERVKESVGGKVTKARESLNESDTGKRVNNMFNKNAEVAETPRVAPSVSDSIEDVVERSGTKVGGRM